MYEKKTYWLTASAFQTLFRALEKSEPNFYETQKAVCLPLSAKVKMGFVAPDKWRSFDLCKRQLSWYENSPYSGKYLVVSDYDLNDYGFSPTTIIRKSKFRPKNLPGMGNGNRLQLIRQESYRKAKPEQWDNLDAMDAALQDRWLKIMGVRGISYPELFISHAANHANFIEPRYYVEENGDKVPYSIDKTTHICSACMEFYNIIGAEFQKKYVVPCPGAVIFAGLSVNKYYEVITVG